MLIILSFASEQERERFEYVFHRYKKLLLYKANGILHDHALAEDATSEAFIRIYKNMHKIDDLDSNQTISFLVTIVTNTALTILNKEKRKQTVVVDFEDTFRQHSDDFDLEQHIVTNVATDNIFGCINLLKEELKAPFLLKYAHQLSHKEIAQILNITENNVTVRIHRAKQKLATILQKEGIIDETA